MVTMRKASVADFTVKAQEPAPKAKDELSATPFGRRKHCPKGKRRKGRLRTAGFLVPVLVLSLVLSGCAYGVGDLDSGASGGAGSGQNGVIGGDDGDRSDDDLFDGNAGTGDSDADGAGGSGGSGGDAADGGSSGEGKSSDDTDAAAIEGPDVPPDGMRYDEWKGFEYSDETSFSTRSYWGIHLTDNSLPETKGFGADSYELDGTLTITDVKAEPVGGEMKLRSGGYVDITIDTEWTATVTYRFSDVYYYLYDYLVWQDVSPTPGDAYTGTSLLNYSDRDDQNAEDNALNIGEGSNSGLVESDVTWNSRIYRLYAGVDSRNASFGGGDYGYDGSNTTITQDLKELGILTFRVPADYDGLILMIPKDISGQKSLGIDERGNILNTKDLYADLLTDISGAKHSADEYYFVKVSDLVEKFQGTENASGSGSQDSSGEDALANGDGATAA